MKSLYAMQQQASKWADKEYGNPADIDKRIEVAAACLMKLKAVSNDPFKSRQPLTDLQIMLLDIASKIQVTGDGLMTLLETRIKWVKEMQEQKQRQGMKSPPSNL